MRRRTIFRAFWAVLVVTVLGLGGWGLASAQEQPPSDSAAKGITDVVKPVDRITGEPSCAPVLGVAYTPPTPDEALQMIKQGVPDPVPEFVARTCRMPVVDREGNIPCYVDAGTLIFGKADHECTDVNGNLVGYSTARVGFETIEEHASHRTR
jgi:hypothetical protein